MKTIESNDAKIDAGDVIGRIKEALEISNDSDLAHYFGISKSTISGWRKRNRVPYEEAVLAARASHSHLDWIITGEETNDLYAGLLEGPIDHQLLSIILLDNVISTKWAFLTADTQSDVEKSQFLSRIISSSYNRHNDMMREAIEKNFMKKEEFLSSLLRAVKSDSNIE